MVASFQVSNRGDLFALIVGLLEGISNSNLRPVVADEMMSSEYHTAGAENRGRASSCQGVSFVPSMSAYSAQLDLFVRTVDLFLREGLTYSAVSTVDWARPDHL
jgi:hypothetical protein